IDNTPPTSSVSFPADGAKLNAAGYKAGCSTASIDDVCGSASDSGGAGLDKVDVRIQRASDSKYWDGSSWQVGIAWNLASGTTSWSYAFSPGQDVYTVISRATDQAGNVETPGAGNTFTIDTTPPTSSVSFPADAAKLNAAGYKAGCTTASIDDLCGSASDSGGAGLDKVEVRIQRASDSKYWDGTSWVASATWNVASGTTSWSYAFSPAQDVYTVTSRAAD